MNESLINALQRKLGSKKVLIGKDIKERYHPIWHTEEPLQAMAVLLPQSTKELADILKICQQHEQAVVVHDDLAKLIGNSETSIEEVVISMEKMKTNSLKMQNCKINEAGNLDITPSINSSKHDFDFYEGKWKITNRRLKERLTNSEEWIEFVAHQEMKIILQGLGNTDDFLTTFDGLSFEGRNLRLFNPQTKLWSVYWADSNSGILQAPTVGSFEGAIGRFYCKDVFKEQEIIVEFIWDKTDIHQPVWSQAFSVDEGKTWEVNWYMYMSRVV